MPGRGSEQLNSAGSDDDSGDEGSAPPNDEGSAPPNDEVLAPDESGDESGRGSAPPEAISSDEEGEEEEEDDDEEGEEDDDEDGEEEEEREEQEEQEEQQEQQEQPQLAATAHPELTDSGDEQDESQDELTLRKQSEAEAEWRAQHWPKEWPEKWSKFPVLFFLNELERFKREPKHRNKLPTNGHELSKFYSLPADILPDSDEEKALLHRLLLGSKNKDGRIDSAGRKGSIRETYNTWFAKKGPKRDMAAGPFRDFADELYYELTHKMPHLEALNEWLDQLEQRAATVDRGHYPAGLLRDAKRHVQSAIDADEKLDTKIEERKLAKERKAAAAAGKKPARKRSSGSSGPSSEGGAKKKRKKPRTEEEIREDTIREEVDKLNWSVTERLDQAKGSGKSRIEALEAMMLEMAD
jgi:hypothetical protein